MSNHEHQCRGCGNDLRRESGNHEANCLASRLAALDKSAQGYYNEAAKAYEERDAALRRLSSLQNAVRQVVELGPSVISDSGADMLEAVLVVDRQEPK